MTVRPPPRAAVCSVGAEVVGGEQVDSNAAWLARRLTELGAPPVLHVAVADRVEKIAEALVWLAARCDVVVVGGGLGPTSDDVTREAVAAAAGVPLVHRGELEEAIRERFEEHGRDMPASNLRQARVPEGAEVYAPVGTAPGFRLGLTGPDGEVPVHVLPGVPWELRAIFERDVEPSLRGREGVVRVARTLLVAGMSEARLAERVDGVLAGRDEVGVAYRASPTGIRVTLTVADASRRLATERSASLVAEVGEVLGHHLAGVDGESLEEIVVRALVDRDESVAVAESATAGQVCARLADVPGASRVLRGGVVVYTSEAKIGLLDLDPGLLRREGPVSVPVTEVLAARVRAVLASDWGVAVTGVAGPEPHGGRAVGTVVWAVAGPDGRTDVHERCLRGDRGTIRTRLGSAALETLRRRLRED